MLRLTGIPYTTICEYLPYAEPKEYRESVRVYVDRKGQYRRPSYLLLWALLYGAKAEDAILPAAVQQASEDWMLMHDDWEDSNLVRRGGPAAHILYGPEIAINAGDALHAIMWKMGKEAADKLGKPRGDRYFNKLFDIIEVTTNGQYYDLRLTMETRDITKFSQADYYQSIMAKAAYYSVYGPMQCGAIIADTDQDTLEHIPEYGLPIGNAFQIKDDILDCTATEAQLGKTIGNDVREGTKTIILWHAVHNASADTLKTLRSIYFKSREEKKEHEIQFVLDTFNELGSIKYAEKEAAKLVKQASSKFDKFASEMPDSKIKRLARDSLGNVITRKK